MKLKNILLSGLGAIGTIYAVKFFEYKSCNFKVLLDENRRLRYMKEKRFFNGKQFDFDYIVPSDESFKADLVIIATKHTGLKEALNNMKNFVTKDTIFISLLNGIESEDEISAFYGKENVLYSYFIGHTSTMIKNNVVFDGYGRIVFGDLENNQNSENVIRVKELFENAKIDYENPKDIHYARFLKFMFNVGLNQTSAILQAPFFIFQVQAIAKAQNVNNTDKMLTECLELVQTMLPNCKTSMLHDVENKRKTEVEIFGKSIIRQGKKFNVPTPYNEIVSEIIEAIDEKNQMLLQNESFEKIPAVTL